METENQNSLWTVHLNVKADVSNKHVSTNHPGKMRALFQISKRILISKHPKLYTSYRQMERNAKIAFSTHQNSEKEHTRTDVPLNFGFSNRQMSHFQVCNIQKI